MDKPMSGAVAPFPRDRFLQFCGQLRIQSKDYGLTRFRLLGSQEYILDEIEQGLRDGISTFVILKSRQLGASTLFLALDMFWAFEYSGLSGAIVVHEDKARGLFRQILTVYLAHLPMRPKAYKVAEVQHNRDMVIFKNGSQLMYLVAGLKERSSAGLGRSGGYNYAHCTEVAFWGNPDDIKAFRAAQSSLYPHRMQIFESTANGFNHFQEMYEAAGTSKVQKAIFVGWWRDERNWHAIDHPHFDVYMPNGIESRLTATERKRAHAVKKIYGYDVKPEQISWYRWKLDDEFSGDQSMMDQEFPWTAEDAFVATGAKFFTNESLTDAFRTARDCPVMPYAYQLGRDWTQTEVHQVRKDRASLKIWEEMVPHGTYVIGCDPAYGSSDEADRSAIEVFRCYADKCVQVAEFISPIISTYQCAWILAHLAGYYSDVMVNLEITGPGTAVFQELQSLRAFAARLKIDEGPPALRNCLSAMRHFLYKRVDSLSGDLAYQTRMTSEQKVIILNAYKDSFELNRCVVKSMPLLEEMKAVVYEDGSIHGEGVSKDDRVMASGLAHEAWRRWVQPRMIAMGMTYARAHSGEDFKPNPLQQRVLNYMRTL